MTKTLLRLSLVLTLAIAGWSISGLVMDEQAQACTKSQRLHDPCGPSPNTKYRGGGHNPKTVRVTVCLPNKVWAGIRQNNGNRWWDFGLYYGTGKPEEVATVRRQCRGQNIRVGDWAIAYINCPGTFVGWMAVKVKASDKGKTITLRRFNLPQRHNPLA